MIEAFALSDCASCSKESVAQVANSGSTATSSWATTGRLHSFTAAATTSCCPTHGSLGASQEVGEVALGERTTIHCPGMGLRGELHHQSAPLEELVLCLGSSDWKFARGAAAAAGTTEARLANRGDRKIGTEFTIDEV
ncbi:hypothetical protein Mapa_001999 [Marchantia paleacea]|nr:hypothetical protein Mapa_001999 [Marchantia paleacea]